MALIPKDSASRLSFFNTHAPIWEERAAEIGLSPEQASEVVAALAAAKEAQWQANIAAEAAKSATARWNLAEETLVKAGANAIRVIKAFAASQPESPNDVYIAASIDAPARTGPKRRTQIERNNAVPNISRLEARPVANGQIDLSWQTFRGATMGAGAGMMYTIARRVDNGPETTIGVIGGPGPGRTSSTFRDERVPARARSITYSVTPMQGGGVGATKNTTVTFGTVAFEGLPQRAHQAA